MRRWNCYARWSKKDHFLNICRNTSYPEDQDNDPYLLEHSGEEGPVNEAPNIVKFSRVYISEVKPVSSGRFQETRFHFALVAPVEKRKPN